MSNENPDTNVRSKPILERHFQSFLLMVVTGLVTWSGYTTFTLTVTSARQDERIIQLINLTENLRQDLREIGEDYMTINDASMYRDQINSRIDALGSRVSRLENEP